MGLLKHLLMGDVEQYTTRPADVPSVDQLNEQIKQQLPQVDELQSVQCYGEVRDTWTKGRATGFTLLDETGKLRGVIWNDTYENLDLTLTVGMEVAVDGDIGYYPRRGRLQIYANDMTVVGTGDRTTATEQLETDLGERGWFDESHDTALPQVPETIGVVTSPDGDARHDITTAIHDSAPAVDILIEPATVQGPNAPQSLANGIQALDRDTDCDVMIVGRGGGSTTDLQTFNSEVVAEAIHDATTPIVSAVGHTDDQLIADRVADVTVTTPREAGKTVVNERGRIWSQLEHLEDDLDNAYAHLEQEHDHEQQLDQAVANAQTTDGRMTTVYKAAIAGLVIVVLILSLLLFL
jgi:exodeoxyribonuclease VII large subunit